MHSLPFPLLAVAILAPFFAALAVSALEGKKGRVVAIGSASLSLFAVLWAGYLMWTSGATRLTDPWAFPGGTAPLAIDALGLFGIVLYASLAVILFSGTPRRDAQPEVWRDQLLMLSGAICAYSADNLVLLLAGWVLTVLPLMLEGVRGDASVAPRFPITRVAHALSCVFLGVGIYLMAKSTLASSGSFTYSLHALSGATPAFDDLWTLAFLLLAVLLRKGVFPFHSWVASSAESGNLLKTSFFTNSHLGVFLVARLAIPLLPRASAELLRPLTDLTLLTALVASLLAVVERNPRRLVALIAVSQSSFILTGFGSGTAEGIAGAMVYWVVVGIATTGVFLVLRLLEVRVTAPLNLNTYYGFAARAPRMACFFVVSALALVGLPGTLGFCAEDLLLHGTMDTHPVIGLLLPVATALNAVSFLRLFNRLFLGKQSTKVASIADVLPRERFALVAGVLAIVLLGLVPGPLVKAIARIGAETHAEEAFREFKSAGHEAPEAVVSPNAKPLRPSRAELGI